MIIYLLPNFLNYENNINIIKPGNKTEIVIIIIDKIDENISVGLIKDNEVILIIEEIANYKYPSTINLNIEL